MKYIVPRLPSGKNAPSLVALYDEELVRPWVLMLGGLPVSRQKEVLVFVGVYLTAKARLALKHATLVGYDAALWVFDVRNNVWCVLSVRDENNQPDDGGGSDSHAPVESYTPPRLSPSSDLTHAGPSAHKESLCLTT